MVGMDDEGSKDGSCRQLIVENVQGVYGSVGTGVVTKTVRIWVVCPFGRGLRERWWVLDAVGGETERKFAQAVMH